MSPNLPVGKINNIMGSIDADLSLEPLINRVKWEIGIKPKTKPPCTCAVISTHESFKFQHEEFCIHFIKGVKQ